MVRLLPRRLRRLAGRHAVTESAWGFRTGFTENDLPEREVGIFPVPTGEGSVQSLLPGLRGGDEGLESSVYTHVRSLIGVPFLSTTWTRSLEI